MKITKDHMLTMDTKGFSFIELMVVMVILGILATYVAPRFMDKADDAKIIRAKVDIAAIETGLKMYRLDNGFYPTTEQGLIALVEKSGIDPVPPKWNEKGYFEKGRLPKDPWSRDYLYFSPGVNDEYDIISYGADGVAGGTGKNRDINSWETE